jgi:ferredoxin--NADP+ reductase
MEPPALNARVVRRTDLHDGLRIIHVRPADGPPPPFKPGQFVVLGLPRAEPGRSLLLRRAYSIASPPGADALEFLLVRIDEGRLTPRLWELREGDPLFLDSAARGEFTLDAVPPHSNLVLFATGTGIAPYMSMLRAKLPGGWTAAARGCHGNGPQPHESGHGSARFRRTVLIHGVRYAADLAYRTELEAFASREAGFRYVPIVSREPHDAAWDGLRGRVQLALAEERFEGLAGFPLSPATCHVLLCGNPAMVREVQGQLESRGFCPHTRRRPGNVHTERYW